MRALAPREGPWPQAVPQQAPGKFSGKRRRLAWIDHIIQRDPIKTERDALGAPGVPESAQLRQQEHE